MPEESAALNMGVAAPQGGSFRERKMAELSRDRQEAEADDRQPAQAEAPQRRTPEPDVESADVEQDEPQGLYADEEDGDELEDSSAALDDETPADEEQEDDGQQVDWEKRYRDLQSETQSIRESRSEMEQEHAESMSQHLQLRFEMEDRLKEAVQRAELMKNVMEGNAAQYRNINWAQIPPDKVQDVQAQAQQAFVLAQQADQAYQHMMQEQKSKLDEVKSREAAVAKIRLKRTIPNWGNEAYNGIREFASSVGMPAQEFNEITNPVIIEALHAYKQLREGASSVQKLTNRKSSAPRGKAAKRQPRDERGQFMTKKTEPNQRGSFADKHRHRLAMERQGR